MTREFIVKRKYPLIAILILSVGLAACKSNTVGSITATSGAVPQPVATQGADLQSTIAALVTENAQLAGEVERLSATPTQAPPTATATPEQPAPPAGAQMIVCPISVCSGPVIWELTNEGYTFTPPPNIVQLAYDYSPASQRLLYSDKFPDHGMGPGNLSVSNLLVLDVLSGESEVIFGDENIVEAVWAPDGQTIAYVLATETTYELHARLGNGDDRLLAQDVAITFSFSPSGKQIAFTRESRYDIPGEPGLYLVDLDSGEERKISDVDRAGYGSVTDMPLWSPDEAYIILPASNENIPEAQMLVATDGSGSGPLTFGESISADRVGQNVGSIVLWSPDGMHVIAVESALQGEGMAFQRIAYYRIDPATRQVVYAHTIADGEFRLIGWSVPGQSVWIHSGRYQILLAPLPAQELEE